MPPPFKSFFICISGIVPFLGAGKNWTIDIPIKFMNLIVLKNVAILIAQFSSN